MPHTSSGTSISPPSVMVVDDDLLVLKSIADMLDDLGYTVIEAKSAEEALVLIGYTEVDLVITDYAMPGMNGLQLIEAIAAERPGTPVLLSTGCANVPLGTRNWLPKIEKPFDQATLARAVEAAMRPAPAMATLETVSTATASIIPFRSRRA